jgi:hypothetical protein
MSLYNKISEIRPLYGGVRRKMAGIWLQKGKLAQALGELRKAADSSPRRRLPMKLKGGTANASPPR